LFLLAVFKIDTGRRVVFLAAFFAGLLLIGFFLVAIVF
jgi:hypothetical protein